MSMCMASPSMRPCRVVVAEPRLGQSGVVKAGDHAPARVSEYFIGFVPSVPELLIAGGLGDECDVDLHLRAALGVEWEQFLDDGERARASVRLVEVALDTLPCVLVHQLHGVDEQIGLPREDVAQRAGGDARFCRDRADGHAADAIGEDDAPGRRRDLLASPVMVDELRHFLMVTRPC